MNLNEIHNVFMTTISELQYHITPSKHWKFQRAAENSTQVNRVNSAMHALNLNSLHFNVMHGEGIL